MNKAQKITIFLTLIALTITLLFPPIGKSYRGANWVLPTGKTFLYDIDKNYQIDTRRLAAELLMIICLGSALTVLFSLRKK